MNIFSAAPVIALLALVAMPHIGGTLEPLPAPLSHSALISLAGASMPGALVLRVRSNTPGTSVNVSDFAVTLDGRELAVTARADGSWRVPLPAGTAAGVGQLEVTVTHDGIREVLDAQIPLQAAAGTSVASGAHRQIVWWILNIAIVLIAALVISRRTS